MLLVVLLFVVIELVYSVPLLTLGVLHGDLKLTPATESTTFNIPTFNNIPSPTVNVSKIVYNISEHSPLYSTIIILTINLQEQGVMQNTVNYRCNQSYLYPYFISLTISYKLILHAVALVLACLIRKLKVDALNDSRETAAIIYASSVLLLLLCVAQFTVSHSYVLIHITLALLVSVLAMIHLGLTFIPKVSPLGPSVLLSLLYYRTI